MKLTATGAARIVHEHALLDTTPGGSVQVRAHGIASMRCTTPEGARGPEHVGFFESRRTARIEWRVDGLALGGDFQFALDIPYDDLMKLVIGAFGAEGGVRAVRAFCEALEGAADQS